MAEVLFACERCGSSRARRAHAAGVWQRLVRSATPYRRYVCVDCGHRGWTPHEFEQAHDAVVPRQVAGGRPLETRDVRAARKSQVGSTVAVIAAILLGSVAAWLLTRAGR